MHPAPDSAADIPDMDTVRLVIVHPRLRLHRDDGAESEAIKWVRAAVASKGWFENLRMLLVFAALLKTYVIFDE